LIDMLDCLFEIVRVHVGRRSLILQRRKDVHTLRVLSGRAPLAVSND
jgi:hypothetical protein